jgi:hypothetical protein
MTLPTAGTRRIDVDGSTYRWRVSVDEDVAFLYPAGGAAKPGPAIDGHSLIVEQPEFAGRILNVAFDFAGRCDLGIPITPGLVAAVIAAAIKLGWPAEISYPQRLYWKNGQLMAHAEWIAARRAAGERAW